MTDLRMVGEQILGGGTDWAHIRVLYRRGYHARLNPSGHHNRQPIYEEVDVGYVGQKERRRPHSAEFHRTVFPNDFEYLVDAVEQI